MNNAVRIRPYAPADLSAVRQICCDTADRGSPIDRFFQDREVFAELLLDYYTSYEPEVAWVAEADGRVVGYLTGCLNDRQYQRTMAWRIVPRAIGRAILRGALWRAQTWALLRNALRTHLRGGFRRRIPLDRYPAHLHLNLDGAFRGRQAGRLLIEQFCAQVRAAGLAGVYAAVRGDNQDACAFFERLGFTPISRHPTLLLHDTWHDTVIYAKSV